MSQRNELGALFVRAAVRGLGGVAAMATLPLLTRAMNASSGRIVAGAKAGIIVARDHACAVKHGVREYRSVRGTLARARRRSNHTPPP